MQMQMMNSLPAVGTSIHNCSIAAAEMLFSGEFFCDRMQVAQQSYVGCIYFCKRRDVLFGDNQQMHRRLRVNVGEGVGEIVVIELRRRDGSGDDFAEDAVHAVRITQGEQVSAPSALQVSFVARLPLKLKITSQF